MIETNNETTRSLFSQRIKSTTKEVRAKKSLCAMLGLGLGLGLRDLYSISQSLYNICKLSFNRLGESAILK